MQPWRPAFGRGLPDSLASPWMRPKLLYPAIASRGAMQPVLGSSGVAQEAASAPPKPSSSAQDLQHIQAKASSRSCCDQRQSGVEQAAAAATAAAAAA